MKKPFKKYYRKPYKKRDQAHFRREKADSQIPEKNLWDPLEREIKYFCNISNIRDYGMDYRKTESGTTFLEINFYRLKKILSKDALEIFDSELARRIENLGFNTLDSRYYKSGFRVTIGQNYARNKTLISETQKIRTAKLEKSLEEILPAASSSSEKSKTKQKDIIARITKKVTSLFKKKI